MIYVWQCGEDQNRFVAHSWMVKKYELTMCPVYHLLRQSYPIDLRVFWLISYPTFHPSFACQYLRWIDNACIILYPLGNSWLGNHFQVVSWTNPMYNIVSLAHFQWSVAFHRSAHPWLPPYQPLHSDPTSEVSPGFLQYKAGYPGCFKTFPIGLCDLVGTLVFNNNMREDATGNLVLDGSESPQKGCNARFKLTKHHLFSHKWWLTIKIHQKSRGLLIWIYMDLPSLFQHSKAHR